MKRMLITGGAGFIGSHLSEALLRAGHSVLALDNLSTGSIKNIEHLRSNSNYKLIEGSVTNLPFMEKILQEVDFIYHLAAAVGVKLIVQDPVSTMETNIRGTEVILHLAQKVKKPILITSTSEVYGKNTKAPFQEDDDMVFGPTTHSRWSYACSKAIDEFLAISHHRMNKLPVIIVRLFNTVGPRQVSQYGMVIPTFVKQALRNEAITVYGDGTQRRTFCYVLDVVRALTTLPENERAYGEVFNIGGNQEISIFDLAGLVKERAKSKSNIIKIPYEKAYAPGFEDMPRRVPDISKISRFIHYEPTFSLNQIIDHVIDYHRQFLT